MNIRDSITPTFPQIKPDPHPPKNDSSPPPGPDPSNPTDVQKFLGDFSISG